MRDRSPTWRAPTRWARGPGEAAPEWATVWRGLTQAYVPDAGGASATVSSRRMVELLHGAPTNQGNAAEYGIEQYPVGPACSVTNAPAVGLVATNSQRWGPAVGAAFSVFVFGLRRDSSSTFQALVGNGFTGLGGWTFQANYGATAPGRLGLTRWGNGDDVTTTALGAVPNDGMTYSGMGVAWPVGGPSRFFLNGRFEDVTSGTISGAGIGDFVIGRTSSGGLQGMALFAVYMWNRALTDGEFQRLYRDPWGLIRPPSRAYAGAIPAVTGRTRVTQLAAEILASPNPALRITQLVAEVLIPTATALRATQVVAEILYQDTTGSGRTRVTQAIAEVLHAPAPSLRATQILAEVLVSPATAVRASQLVVEVLLATAPALRASQLVVEVLHSVPPLTLTYKGQLFPKGSSLIQPA